MKRFFDASRRPWLANLSVSAATFALIAAIFVIVEILFRAFVEPKGEVYDSRHLAYLAWAAEPPYRVKSLGRKPLLAKVFPQDIRTVLRGVRTAPIPLAKTPGKRRIAIVGESSANSMEYALPQMLDGIGCGDRFEILQCSVPGSTLPQLVRRFDQALAYDPDVIAVIFGHNLYFQALSDPAVIRVERIRAMSRLLSYLVEPKPMASLPGRPEDRLRELEEALRRFAEATKARGISLVVSTMASNLWTRPNADQGELEDPAYLEALYLDESGRSPEAVGALSRLVERQPQAIYHFVLGDWLYRRGDYSAASEHLQTARDLDRTRIRASRAVNELIRRVCAETGCLVRDTEGDLARISPHGIPGWEAFIDNCHLHFPLAREALALARVAAPTGAAAQCIEASPRVGDSRAGAAGAPPWIPRNSSPDRPEDDPEVASLRAEIGNSLRSVLSQAGAANGNNALFWTATLDYLVESALARGGEVGASEIEREFSGPEMTKLNADISGQALLGLARGFFRAGRVESALTRIAEAKKGPQAAAAWLLEGHFELRRGKLEAARHAFDEALRRAPDSAEARFFRGRIDLSSGLPNE